MITFTVSQINSALENVSQSMAERIRYVMPIDINNTGDIRRYTIAELRDSGQGVDSFYIVCLILADQRTPLSIRAAFADENKRLDRENLLLPYKAPKDGPSSKSWMLLEFLEKSLAAYNATHNTGEATQ